MVVDVILIRVIRSILLRFLLFPVKIQEILLEVNKRAQCRCAVGVIFAPASSVGNVQENPDKIVIGAHTAIHGQLSVFKHGGGIEIGSHCFLGEGSRIWSAKNISIGNNVLISHNVNIHDHNAHPISAERRKEHYIDLTTNGFPLVVNDVPSKPIVIGDNVWIGFNATIMKGVTIGEGAIIGACSMVTHNVAPYTIVGGNPAKVIGNSTI